MKVFSVYDSKGEFWSQPQFQLNAGVALRAFADAAVALNGESMLSQHPEDFTLFEIGNWDERTGDYIVYDAKIALGVALEYINRDKPVVAAVPDPVSKVQGGE